jgi:hypothetical protein
MKQFTMADPKPEASICVNKCQLKLHNKTGQTPAYYLENGQEFQIQLFNPTQNTILAKIEINGNPISQGGLVLKPAERVFLERYLDVAKKFLFETYEVSNTKEVHKAIENYGGIKIEFYNEYIPQPTVTINYPSYGYPNVWYHNGSNANPLIGTTTNNYFSRSLSSPTFDLGNNITSASAGISSYTNYNESASLDTNSLRGTRQKKSKKSIETGRVETGTNSEQQLKYVDKTFEYFAFHSIEFKLLPISQKVNTTKDVISQHCTNCGAKRKATHKFCANCGKKL